MCPSSELWGGVLDSDSQFTILSPPSITRQDNDMRVRLCACPDAAALLSNAYFHVTASLTLWSDARQLLLLIPNCLAAVVLAHPDRVLSHESGLQLPADFYTARRTSTDNFENPVNCQSLLTLGWGRLETRPPGSSPELRGFASSWSPLVPSPSRDDVALCYWPEDEED